MDILSEQVTEYLTAALGRAPTAAELANGIKSPWSLANVHNTLTPGTSTLAINSTDNIQTAIDSLVANGGGVLYLNPGTYNVASNITIPSNIALQGFLRDSTIIDFGGGAHSIRSVGTNAYTTGTVSISNGSTALTGSGTAWNSTMIGQTVWLESNYYTVSAVGSATSITLDSAYIDATLSGAPYAIADPITSLNIKNITIQNSSTYGIFVAYSIGGYIFSNFNVFNCTTAAIRSEWSTYPNIDLASIDSCGIGCDFYYTNGYGFTGSVLTNSTTVGLKLVHSGNSTIFNSEMSSSGTSGISITNSSDISMLSMVTARNGTNGIEVVSGSDDLQMNSIGILDNIGDGIKLTAGATNVQVSSNTISGNGGYGVNLADASDVNNIIAINSFSANTTAAVNNSGTTTLIRSNIGVADN